MTQIAPRFFVLPAIALIVILSLPRPAADRCQDTKIEPTEVVSVQSSGCTPAPGQLVMAPRWAMVR